MWNKTRLSLPLPDIDFSLSAQITLTLHCALFKDTGDEFLVFSRKACIFNVSDLKQNHSLYLVFFFLYLVFCKGDSEMIFLAGLTK